MVPRTQSRVARYSWSNLRTFGPEPEATGTAGRHCGPSDTGLSLPGQLVDTEGTRPQARVPWDSWSALRALGHVPEFPGTVG